MNRVERRRELSRFNMPRIMYAYTVVKNRKLPKTVPGDLAKTDQVREAQVFLADFARHSTRMTFEGDVTGTLPVPDPGVPQLTEADFERVAQELGVEVSAIKAIATTESGGKRGFSADGRPIIRFELHVFHGHSRVGTGGRFGPTHPHLSQSSPALGEGYHLPYGQSTEWNMMYEAMLLRDNDGNQRFAAWKSASWGMFQVMGFNFKEVGWQDIESFVRDMCQSELHHLRAFAGAARAAHLVPLFKAHNWAKIAEAYNGKKYKENNYDVNLANNYAAIRSMRQRAGLTP
jgi:hypothetical protein